MKNQISTFGSGQADAYAGPFIAGPSNCTDFLPVELLDFNATPVGERVRLDWITATELNNDYFTVERSVNGTTFEILTHVEGAGTTQEMREYRAYDETPYAGKMYYRLKQTDFDGSFSYSEVVEVYIDADRLSNKLAAYPNPLQSGESLNLAYEAPEAGEMMLEMTDGQGRTVMRELKNVKAGLNEWEIDRTQLANGMYTIRLVNERYSETLKVVVH